MTLQDILNQPLVADDKKENKVTSEQVRNLKPGDKIYTKKPICRIMGKALDGKYEIAAIDFIDARLLTTCGNDIGLHYFKDLMGICNPDKANKITANYKYDNSKYEDYADKYCLD